MNETTQTSDGVLLVSSRDVAANFGKQHKNVLRDIANVECSHDFRRLNFELTTYPDTQGRPQSEVLLTRNGCVLLTMGFTGAKVVAPGAAENHSQWPGISLHDVPRVITVPTSPPAAE